MKNNNSELKQAIKKAEEYLKEFMKDPRLTHKIGAGLCAFLTRIGHDLLSKAGFPLRIAGGKAAFGVNKGKWGIMDFGYSPYFPAPGTAYIGHFWLVADEPEWIIDFTLMFLKETMFTSDQERGLPRQPVNLRTNVIVPIRKLSSFDELMAGKMGWHYQEIPGRDKDLFLDPVPNLPDQATWCKGKKEADAVPFAPFNC